MTGDFMDSIDFGNTTLTSHGESDVFVTKLTDHGSHASVEWANRAGGRDSEGPRDIAVYSTPGDPDAVYLAGTFTGSKKRDATFFGQTELRSAGRGDMFVTKVDGDTGEFKWAERYGGVSDDNVFAIEVDDNGDIYAAGRFTLQGDFGGFTLESGGVMSDAFVAKIADLGNQGDVTWVRQVTAPDGSWGSDVEVEAGHVYLTGKFKGTATFDSVHTVTSRGMNDGFLGAYDTDGNVEFAVRMGGSEEDWAVGVAARGSAIYVEGNFDSAGADFPTGDVLSNSVSYEIFTMKLDTVAPPRITVTPLFGLETTEAGDTAMFDVVLDTQPTADVTIDVSSSDQSEGTIVGATAGVLTLTFDDTNWNVPQTVTVKGADDEVQDGDQAYAIQLAPATSIDPAYNGVDATDVSVTNLDNEVPPPTNDLVYAWDMTHEIRNRGKHTDVRFTIDVNQDSNFDGMASSSDSAAANALVTIALYDSSGSGIPVGTYTGSTDSGGIFRTNWIRGLESGAYTAEVADVALDGFDWNQLLGLDGLFHDDEDGNGLPDELFTIP